MHSTGTCGIQVAKGHQEQSVYHEPNRQFYKNWCKWSYFNRTTTTTTKPIDRLECDQNIYGSHCECTEGVSRALYVCATWIVADVFYRWLIASHSSIGYISVLLMILTNVKAVFELVRQSISIRCKEIVNNNTRIVRIIRRNNNARMVRTQNQSKR